MNKKNNVFYKHIYIFIYVLSFLTTGCEDSIIYDTDLHFNDEETIIEDLDDIVVDYFLDVTSDSLELNNGFYMMEYLNGYNQTFTTLTAETGSLDSYQHIAWMSNKEIKIGDEWINLVNGASYTDEFGEAHTVLSIWPEFINDTIKVYAGYNDEYGNHYVDSLKVIVIDEE